MKVYYYLEEIPLFNNPIVTIGNFDGVHIGHIHVLESLVKQETDGYQSVVITFWPHPKRVLDPDSNIKFLTTINEKIELIAKIGIKHLLILPFTTKIADMTAKKFVEDVLISKIGTKKIILGYDHRFGKDRVGGLEFLHEYNSLFHFQVEEIPKKEVENISISTSKIKYFLSVGQIKDANALLGRKYNISGKIVKGKQLGRTIGFPTANIKLVSEEKLIPSTGVYIVQIYVHNKSYYGMMNIGYRPTVSGKDLTIEVNIFDFNGDIYDAEVNVQFIDYIRPEKKFSNLEDLKNQLDKDRNTAIVYLKELNDK